MSDAFTDAEGLSHCVVTRVTRTGRAYNPFDHALASVPFQIASRTADVSTGLRRAFEEEDRQDVVWAMDGGDGPASEGAGVQAQGVHSAPAGSRQSPRRGRVFSSPLSSQAWPRSLSRTPSPLTDVSRSPSPTSDPHLPSRAPSPLTDVSRTPSPCPVAAVLPSPIPVSEADPSTSKAGVCLPSQSTVSGVPSGSSTLSEAVKMHRAKSKAASRAKKRLRLRPEGTGARGSTKVRSSLARRPMKAIAVPTGLNAAQLRRDQWSYIGARRKRLKAKPWTCDELLAIGFERMRWDGFTPHALCDPEGRIVAYFPGRPHGSGWDGVVEEVTVALESAELESRGYSTTGLVDRRRGLFLALNTGPSYGGGPKVRGKALILSTLLNRGVFQRPGNLGNTAPMQRILDRLLGNWAVQRVAGFGSSIFAHYAPKVYAYYEENFEKLRARFPGLKWPFENSIFPTCTFNLGPATVCLDHVDSTNVPHGWCVITPFGRFDPTKGGQLILWEFGLIVDVPPGSSVEIPSASVRHANTAVAKGETRFSFTQYCPGGLLRYARHGFRPAGTLSYRQRVEMDGLPDDRWQWALSLFSTVTSLVSDRLQVFGNRS